MKKLQQFFTSLVAVLTVFAFGSTALAQTVDSGKVEQALLLSLTLHKVKLTLPINSLMQL
ncbi:autotransporter adhesin [Streptococcus suis]|nr:autotransporter adhesin [Streptococcus suis]CZB09041.1 autotransporter adhesin [Streptococcus suis]